MWVACPSSFLINKVPHHYDVKLVPEGWCQMDDGAPDCCIFIITFCCTCSCIFISPATACTCSNPAAGCNWFSPAAACTCSSCQRLILALLGSFAEQSGSQHCWPADNQRAKKTRTQAQQLCGSVAVRCLLLGWSPAASPVVSSIQQSEPLGAMHSS